MKKIVVAPNVSAATVMGVGTPPSKEDRVVILSARTHDNLLQAVDRVIEEALDDGMNPITSIVIFGFESGEKEN